MKILLIICDGMGDRLIDGKTPLEAARKPNMDFIAKNGITGIMDSVGPGVRPGSDTAHLSLFGYNPFDFYTGRGPFEALGAGLSLRKGDVALRCNFATLQNGKVIDRRAGRDEFGLEELANELDGMEISGTEIIFKKCSGHRAVLILRGENLSANVSDTDPEIKNAKPLISKPLDRNPDSTKTAEIINKFTQKSIEILGDHPINKERTKMGKLPANIILVRGAGIQTHLPPFNHRYKIKGACISATTLIRGVCRAIGMDIIGVEGATGHVDSNIGGKANAAINALKSYDFVFLHIKGTDEASHDGNFDLKKAMIERIDGEVIKPILENRKDVTIVLTSDHSTPISIRQHSADPVPIAILGDVRTDSVERFTERECAMGGLNRICGIHLMGILLDLTNRAELFGA
ncbi:MAG: 2,3-bisphosphoglycerate-independent phosphoglycerate mutase [Candidatus Altiarchaeales archaeon]|nr:MAG: 2,3-bisphosphoglycerate-independent phosphoglycerate mutase [Candidatus Altiarchaeales archaeon]HDO82767.1 2,3-bisphosphoglycerate-independent phosphoglycerate mutase [Candidatus Altiarchaeales archaeon]HEX55416.1 2,3-bisphosphoglycerate-independent phosphoglycerate mutase [Candidatus Altiarchaeales archaeon]